MPDVCLYFQVHQPYRLLSYDFFKIGENAVYEDEAMNREILNKVARIKTVADRYGISMKAAGLQFALANPVVAAVIPGASRPSRITEDRAALEETIPVDFWRELRSAGLVNPAAPLPSVD